MISAPPHNKEAEQFALTTLLFNPHRMDEAASLHPDDFYFPIYRETFQVMRKLDGEGTPPDITVVMAEMQNNHKFDEYSDIIDGMVSSKLPKHINTIKELSIRRRAITTAGEVAAMASDKSMDLGAMLDQSESMIFSLRDDTEQQDEPVHVKKLLKDVFVDLEDRYKNGGGITGISTGFAELDEITAGLQRKDLIIMAGRPSMGKTALSLGVAMGAAKAKHPTLFFSMEMGGNQITERIISSEGVVNSKRMRNGQFKDSDWNKITTGATKASALPLWIDDTPNISALDIRARARRHKKAHGLGLIVIDYLGLMKKPKAENNTLAVGNITKALKNLAKELDVPVVLLSQLNRSLENRTNKRPMMSDLRESGDIEQDADVILFVYRDAVYCDKCKDPNIDCDIPNHHKSGEVIIGKQRNGETGTVELVWHGEITSYADVVEPGY